MDKQFLLHLVSECFLYIPRFQYIPLFFFFFYFSDWWINVMSVSVITTFSCVLTVFAFQSGLYIITIRATNCWCRLHETTWRSFPSQTEIQSIKEWVGESGKSYRLVFKLHMTLTPSWSQGCLINIVHFFSFLEWMSFWVEPFSTDRKQIK